MNFSIDPLPEESSLGIDLTSLVDVLFVLLLFFMVTTTFSNTDSIAIKLPVAKSTAAEPQKKDLAVLINQAGEIFVDAKPKTIEQLSKEFSELKASGSEITVVIRADKGVSHGAVVSVLDSAKSAGIDRIAIATESPK